MANLRKQGKSLLIFDLNGVLGHFTNDYLKYRSTGIYQTDNKQDLLSVSQAIWQERDQAIFARPNL
jgi:hypothetical protein